MSITLPRARGQSQCQPQRGQFREHHQARPCATRLRPRSEYTPRVRTDAQVSSELRSSGTSTACSWRAVIGTISRPPRGWRRTTVPRRRRGRPAPVRAVTHQRSRDQAGEPVPGHRGGQVVADPALVLEELRGDHRADVWQPEVLRSGDSSRPGRSRSAGRCRRVPAAAQHVALSHGDSIARGRRTRTLGTHGDRDQLNRMWTATRPAAVGGCPRGTAVTSEMCPCPIGVRARALGRCSTSTARAPSSTGTIQVEVALPDGDRYGDPVEVGTPRGARTPDRRRSTRGTRCPAHGASQPPCGRHSHPAGRPGRCRTRARRTPRRSPRP